MNKQNITDLIFKTQLGSMSVSKCADVISTECNSAVYEIKNDCGCYLCNDSTQHEQDLNYLCKTCKEETEDEIESQRQQNAKLIMALTEILNDAKNYDGECFDLCFESIADKAKQALEQAK